MSEPESLINLLAVPGIHSGTDLGEQLGISRVAIKKRIDRLESTGFPVETIAGRGYRLKTGFELLSAEHISNSVAFENQQQRLSLRVFQSLDSTNAYIADSNKVDKTENQLLVALAESQPQGQGRRGRSWVTSPYKNLMLSIGYQYSSWPDNPSAISLAFSVAVHRALVELGATDVRLKWPNDLVADIAPDMQANIESGRQAPVGASKQTNSLAKLGGLLVSAAGETGGEFALVLGVGINMRLGSDLLSGIDQPAVDLDGLGCGQISRNQLAAAIISNSADMLSLYPDTGFEPFADYWNKHAAFVGQQVRLFDGDCEYVGELQGVDKRGELCLLDSGGKMCRFNKSELSLRAA